MNHCLSWLRTLRREAITHSQATAVRYWASKLASICKSTVNGFISNDHLDTDAPHQTGKTVLDRIFVSQRLEMMESDGAI
jgi:hypothetical protein